jgi:hypothetical protein
MFGALPSFGLYVRHARVTLRNVELPAVQPDVRPALVADDVTELHVAGLNGLPTRGRGARALAERRPWRTRRDRHRDCRPGQCIRLLRRPRPGSFAQIGKVVPRASEGRNAGPGN